MARPAPGTDRTIALLEYLATHPDTNMTLTELSKALSLNKATAHAMLATLETKGYVIRREDDLSFHVGPSVVSLGEAASRALQTVERIALPEMLQIADELGVCCVASKVEGDEIVIVEVAGKSSGTSAQLEKGESVPLAPPLGALFVAWAREADIDAWLRAGGATDDPAEEERYRQVLAAVRRRGYSVAIELPAHLHLHRLVNSLGGRQARAIRETVDALYREMGHDNYLAINLERDRTYDLAHIAAPIFNADSSIVLSLTLSGLDKGLTIDQVPLFADRLCRGTRKITERIGGRYPSPRRRRKATVEA